MKVAFLIEYQILVPDLQGRVWQLEGRINIKILGIKGLRLLLLYLNFMAKIVIYIKIEFVKIDCNFSVTITGRLYDMA